MMIVLGWILASLCAMITAYWLVARWYVHLAHRSMPPVAQGLSYTPPDDQWPSVSIVIPAHNEEGFIDRALTSLSRSDYPDLQIIVAADRCTDQTAAQVRRCAQDDPRIELVEIDECPSDWSGKCHASWRGAQRASGDYLLFTDADTIFAPDLVRAAIGLCFQQRLDFLSLLGALSSEHAFEKTAQPVAAMALMVMYPIHRANRNDGSLRRPFANGQFMLFRRSVYDAIGTHAFIKDAILEDLRFARRLARDNEYRMGLTTAGELFKVRMYETWNEFTNGWKRIYTEAANRYPRRLTRSAWRLRIVGLATLIPWLTLVFAALTYGHDRPLAITASVLALAAIIVQGVTLSTIYRMQAAPVSSIWRYPVGCLRVGRILLDAARDLRENRGIQWGNRRYDIKGFSEHEHKRKSAQLKRRPDQKDA